MEGTGVRQDESYIESKVCHTSAWGTATLRSTCGTGWPWEVLWACLLKLPWSSCGVDSELAARRSMAGGDDLPLERQLR